MITFREVLTTNIVKILNLHVKKEQEDFVASNAISLAEAFATRNEGHVALPFAIYEDEMPVGFIMFGYGDMNDPDSPEISKDNYCIWRLMVDEKHQGRGLSAAILQKAISYLRTFPAGSAEYVWLSYEKENEQAKHVYAKAGFVENGQMCDDEVVAVRKLF